jgi:hypothetical protein
VSVKAASAPLLCLRVGLNAEAVVTAML